MENRQSVRMEQDALGAREIPKAAYYGIHTARAMENFAVSGRTVNPRLLQGIVTVKKRQR